MNQTISRHNDYYAISRSRGVRRQSTSIARLLKKCVVIVSVVLVTVLLHQYLHMQITLTKAQIAGIQKTTLNLQNQEQSLTQDIESLKHPQRIGQLASAMGMFPPRALVSQKTYNVQYASLIRNAVYSKAANREESSQLGKRFETVLAKFVTYYQRAEAKP